MKSVAMIALLSMTACGARTSLQSGLSSGQGGDGAVSSTSTATTTTVGTGAGGGAQFLCPSLVWAGAPLYVPTFLAGDVASAPHLVDIGGGDYAVTFEANGFGPDHDVASFKVNAPFTTWPPTVGTVDVQFPTPTHFASARGEPGQFAFASHDGANNFVLGQSPPGENGSTIVTWPGPIDDVELLSGTPFGAYLVGHGSANHLSATFLPGFFPEPAAVELGTIGCSLPSVPASVVTLAPVQWLVASATSERGGTCVDPGLGPPLFLETKLATPTGLTLVSERQLPDPSSEVHLALRGNGAWLANTTAQSTDVFSVDAHGVIDFASQVSWVSGQPKASHDIASIGDTFAFSELVAQEVQPGGDLKVAIFSDFQFISLGAFPLGIFPTDQPTLATSTDHKSILVAFVDEGDVSPRIGLLRADCANGGGGD